jgi:hypothetical protein
LGVYVGVAPVAALVRGRAGLAAAAAAAGLCLLGAILGLALAFCFRGLRFAAVGFALGMLPRMGIPLGGGVAVQFMGGPLAEGGIMIYLLLFYPVTLAFETWLLVGAGSGPGSCRAASGKGGLESAEREVPGP